MSALRVLFAGSPAIAVPALEAIALSANRGFELVGLLTNPDSPRGRSGSPQPTDCAKALSALGGFSFPILKPEKLDSETRARVLDLAPDILVSFAYGKIFGPRFLALFPAGGINAHPSLLPRLRGPTPIPAAIMGMESETGMSIQRLALGMDEGDVLAQETVPLDGSETTASLSDTMSRIAARMLPDVLARLAAGTVEGVVQDGGAATYCALTGKEDGLIDWGMGAREIEARIRAFDPWPLSWTVFRGERLFVLAADARWSDTAPAAFPLPSEISAVRPGRVLGKVGGKGIMVATGDGVLAVTALQLHGRRPLDWRAFLNGARDFIGSELG